MFCSSRNRHAFHEWLFFFFFLEGGEGYFFTGLLQKAIHSDVENMIKVFKYY